VVIRVGRSSDPSQPVTPATGADTPPERSRSTARAWRDRDRERVGGAAVIVINLAGVVTLGG